MTDSFSSASDSERNFFRRRWRWIVGALVLYFIVGDWPAVSLGYAETVTQTVIENGKPVDKEMTSWLSSSAQFFRDWRDVLIGITATIVFVMTLWRKITAFVMTLWRKIAPNRQPKAARERAKIDNLQAQHDRDRIAGKQFSNAVKLLAQKDTENKPVIDASIGGIYSLQTLANNHIAEYGAQVVKTLIVYIKQNAQLTAQPPLKENETPQKARALGEDVKTAFNVLEQLLAAREKDSAEWNKPPDGIKLSDQDLSFSDQDFSWLDLSSGQVGGLHRYIWSQVNLQGAKLLWAHLQDAKLRDAKLQGANLWGVNLRGAYLARAELQGANLARAYLHGATLFRANLHGADLARAELQGANLSWTELQGVNFRHAKLHGASLSEAQLQGANLSWAELQYADLSAAKLNGETTLPSILLSGKFWHSGQPELLGIVSPSLDDEWNLTSFLCSSYALVGVLRNFSVQHNGEFFIEGSEQVTYAKNLRVAARKLLDEKKLPKDFPQDWRDWLNEIKLDGSHPNDLNQWG